MTHRPYVGVTGVMSAGEARACIAAWTEAWAEVDREPTHDLMLGVLASDKTLAGRTNKYPRRYPRIEEVPDILEACSAPGVLPLVHYAGEKHLDRLWALHQAAGPACAGYQFNGTWPERGDLVALLGHVEGRDLRVVLQAGPKVLAECSAGASLAWRLKPYAGLATDVLIDASGGRGLPIDAEAAAWPITHIAEHDSAMGCGIAGGFCAETLTPVVGRMLRARCSIDAEGRLRDDADGGGNLDLDKVRAYLQAAVRLAVGVGS